VTVRFDPRDPERLTDPFPTYRAPRAHAE